ncbi:MAG: hypothetical protein ACJ76H_16760 [Bacteriovoracaceae bacterium]
MTHLYSDESIHIDTKTITILNYYFPSGSPKEIELSSIKNIKREKLTAFNGKFRYWGMGLRPYWFNRQFRNDKSEMLIINTGEFIKPAVTPRSIDDVQRVLLSLGVYFS